jgi:hypothetical protein
MKPGDIGSVAPICSIISISSISSAVSDMTPPAVVDVGTGNVPYLEWFD